MTYPESWEIPRWHADFGDPAVEVELLRAFCVSARETFPRLKTTLCAIEEGYLNVDVSIEDTKIAELYVVSDKGRQRIAIFGWNGEPESDENYFEEHERGLKILARLIKYSDDNGGSVKQ